MKTLKVEAVYLAAHETFKNVTADLQRFIDDVCDIRRLDSAMRYLSPVQSRTNTPGGGQSKSTNLSIPRGALH